MLAAAIYMQYTRPYNRMLRIVKFAQERWSINGTFGLCRDEKELLFVLFFRCVDVIAVNLGASLKRRAATLCCSRRCGAITTFR